MCEGLDFNLGGSFSEPLILLLCDCLKCFVIHFNLTSGITPSQTLFSHTSPRPFYCQYQLASIGLYSIVAKLLMKRNNKEGNGWGGWVERILYFCRIGRLTWEFLPCLHSYNQQIEFFLLPTFALSSVDQTSTPKKLVNSNHKLTNEAKLLNSISK